jgi:predicted Zn-dependent protease
MDNVPSDTPKTDLPVSTAMVQCLMEIGYVAVGRGFQSQATNIFKGIIAARPSSELPLIGLAVCKLNFGYVVEAAKILAEQALRLNPDSGIAKCFLAVAAKALGKEQEACDLMRHVCNDTTSDPSAKAMAESFLSGKDVSP